MDEIEVGLSDMQRRIAPFVDCLVSDFLRVIAARLQEEITDNLDLVSRSQSGRPGPLLRFLHIRLHCVKASWATMIKRFRSLSLLLRS